jgi:hypothetical protein
MPCDAAVCLNGRPESNPPSASRRVPCPVPCSVPGRRPRGAEKSAHEEDTQGQMAGQCVLAAMSLIPPTMHANFRALREGQEIVGRKKRRG